MRRVGRQDPLLGRQQSQAVGLPCTDHLHPELYDNIAVGDFHVCAKSGGKTEVICWGDSTESVVKDTPKIQTESMGVQPESQKGAMVNDGLDDDSDSDDLSLLDKIQLTLLQVMMMMIF